MATHDYVIDNSTGANVRADINNVLQAILTNNSSSSAPSTTAAYMFWADTTTGTLKIRNSSDNAWVELLQLDGTLTLEDGSASTPGLAFRSDLNTGIFRSGSDNLAFASGGVERVDIGTGEISVNDTGVDCDFRIEGDAQTHLFFLDAGNDRIGIRQSSPQTTLDINGNLTISDSIIHSGDTNTLIRFPSNDNIQFDVNGSERLRIDDSDFVTVKHATTAKLRIQNSTAATSQVCMVDMAPAGTASGVQLKCTSDEDFSTGANRTAHFEISIRKDGTFATRLNIDNAGNVSIGSTATGRKLSVVDTAGAILELTSNTATANSAVYLHEGSIGGTTNGGAIQYDGTNNCLKLSCGTTLTTEAIRIRRDNQHVGIGQGGSYNPGTPLEVRNPAGTTPSSGSFSLLTLCAQHNSSRGLVIGTGRPTSGNQNDAGVFYNAQDTESSTYSAQHIFQRGGSNILVMGYAGTRRVGIGTDFPSSILHVKDSHTGTLNPDSYPTMTLETGATNGAANSGTGIIFLNHNGSGGTFGGSIQCLKSNGNVGNTGNYIRFGTRPQGGGAVKTCMELAASGVNSALSSTHCHQTLTEAGAGTSQFLYRGHHSSGATISFNVWSNGNVQNINNSYGALSDIKLKENIVDANSQWNDIKAIKIRNYNYKAETGQDTHTQIGCIAQEIETVSPKLVYETADTKGKDVEDLGTTTKSINYSVLYMKGLKALQEAMAKIEVLETKVAALEAA